MAHLSIWQQKYKTLSAVAFENYDESILVTIVRVILKKNHNGGFASKTERKSKTNTSGGTVVKMNNIEDFKENLSGDRNCE